jgi:hypothetical protein
MRDDIARFVATWLPCYIRDNRNYLTVAIGCTGGQHRSVYIAEWLAARIPQPGPRPGPPPHPRWRPVMHWLALIRPGDWLVMVAGAVLVGVSIPTVLARRDGRPRHHSTGGQGLCRGRFAQQTSI